MNAGAARPTRTLAVCADDFGLAAGLSAPIVALARAQRLNAISCITNSPHWTAAARQLEGLPPSVDVGLHINLTEGRPLSRTLSRMWPDLPALPILIARAHLGLLPRAALRAEIHAQVTVFRNTTDAAPDFIDGHQHIHHLPVLRNMILDMVEHVQPLPAVRNTGQLPGSGYALKRWLIAHTGGLALQQALCERALPHNPALLGVYDFHEVDYRRLVQQWLVALPDAGGLLFCHPGESDRADLPDPIAAARRHEHAYLASGAFLEDLRAANVTLGSVWGCPPQPAPGHY